MYYSALLTDFYQITMAYGYWRSGIAERPASFYMNFRKAPFKGEYLIFAGLETLIQNLKNFKFSTQELDYLASLKNANQQPVFEKTFLDYLAQLKLTITLEAPAEGTLVFAHQPIVRVTGPLLQAQLLETFILNTINFQSLIATKAARICLSANNKPVLEFGLRRAQGADGGLSASRAAFIGGCQATSNVFAGQQLGIPVSGTQSHSWVMSFDDEQQAFDQFAEIYGDQSVLLVDTYQITTGIQHAIQTAKQKLHDQLKGIRIDSGDLTYLSQQSRNMLDAAGLTHTKIYASNDLDEYIIADLERQHAKIDSYGVGTKLSTAYDQPALGGVYKLSAIQDQQGQWQYKLKLSEQIAKISTPGLLRVKRCFENQQASYDVIYDELLGISNDAWIIDPLDPTRRRPMRDLTHAQELLQPIFMNGQLVHDHPPIQTLQNFVKQQLQQFHPSMFRLLNPHRYPVGLESRLYDLKMAHILALKKK